MKRSLQHLCFAVAVCSIAVVPQARARKPSPPTTLAELAKRTAPIDRDIAVAADPAQAADGYRAFLEIDDADPMLRAQALRRLGDLGLAAAESLDAQGADATAVQAHAGEAIAAYRRLLREYPDRPGADSVIYQLARALESAGEVDAALATLDLLVARYPQTVHYDEAQFRRGEAAFVAARYADAERAYAAVLAREPRSTFHDPALYKQAWAYFRLARDDESRAAFLGLLDRLLVGRHGAPRVLSRAEREMSEDALRALSISFASADGAATLAGTLDAHGPAPYEAQLYRALGDLHVEKQRYQDAAETYRAFAKRRPDDPEAPLLLLAATGAYARGGFAALVLEGKRELAVGYGPGSVWWQVQGASPDPQVAAALQGCLLDLARHHHALAQRGGAAATADFDAAVRWYRAYLAGFDSASDAQATRLLLADLLFERERHADAALEYERAAYGYPRNADSARAGYASLVAFERAAAAAPESQCAALRLRAVEPALRFTTAFPDHPQAPAVLTRSTQTLFDAGDALRAEDVAEQLLALGTRADITQQRAAWTVLAHVYFDSARYQDAEPAYAQLLALLPTDDAARGELVERLAASIYRQAEAKQRAGDASGAVDDLLRIATVAPTSTVRATAEFDAAMLLVAEQDWPRAATVLRAFRDQHPGDERAGTATRQLALVHESSGRPGDAAQEYERVAADATQVEAVRRAALWQAAESYQAANDATGTARTYAAYVERYPTPLDAAMDARAALADLARDNGDAGGRHRWLEQQIEADAAAGAARSNRSTYLAARATLELALPLDAAARALALTLPLERTLLAKKTAFEAALTSLRRAAEYGIADVTTSADHVMAELYRDMGRALMVSQRPADLNAEELEQYDLLLEEQAFPFEEKAIELHERNARRAAEGLYDDAVRRSYAALAELKPARYARREVHDGGPVTDLPAVEAEALAAPADASVLNRLGVAYREAGHFTEARSAYERAIALDALRPAPQRNLAILLDLYLGETETALPYYERYQALNGGADADGAAWLVEVRARLGQVQRTAEARR